MTQRKPKPRPCTCSTLDYPHRPDDRCAAYAQAREQERDEIADQQRREWAAERGRIARDIRR